MPDESGPGDRNQREHAGRVLQQGSDERAELFVRERIWIKPFDLGEVAQCAFTDIEAVHNPFTAQRVLIGSILGVPPHPVDDV